MHIENLSLIDFKNYEKLRLTFSPKINCLVGLNGSGKTNILDAIHYLSMTKSAHNSIDNQNIKLGAKYFSIKGTFSSLDSKSEVVCYYEEGSKKSFKVNKKDYERLSEHIGKYPTVLVTPYDTDIIREGSETRRKFFDSILSQLNHSYLNVLLKYNNNLKQRNSALKYFAKTKNVNNDLLDGYDAILLKLGRELFSFRRDFLKLFIPIFLDKYSFISSDNENVSIEYISQFDNANPESDLKNLRKKDMITERSNFGIHKDDFKLLIYNQPVKKFGSQGQQKSVSMALKLAQFSVIDEDTGIKPILLLDDIFDKLDGNRINKLLTMIKNGNFGQVFITDAIIERTKRLLHEFDLDINIYLVDNARVDLQN